jgi:hypothetical protein
VGAAHLVGPADTAGKCVMCLMTAKQAQFDAYKPEIEAAWKADASEIRWFAWLPALDKDIRDAVCTGICGEAPQMGLVLLCWDHLAGWGKPAVQHLTVPDGLVPPGLLKGKGGR